MADNRKIGRNADYCKAYANSHRQEKNQAKKLKKHLERFPDDKVAAQRLKEVSVHG